MSTLLNLVNLVVSSVSRTVSLENVAPASLVINAEQARIITVDGLERFEPVYRAFSALSAAKESLQGYYLEQISSASHIVIFMRGLSVLRAFYSTTAHIGGDESDLLEAIIPVTTVGRLDVETMKANMIAYLDSVGCAVPDKNVMIVIFDTLWSLELPLSSDIDVPEIWDDMATGVWMDLQYLAGVTWTPAPVLDLP